MAENNRNTVETMLGVDMELLLEGKPQMLDIENLKTAAAVEFASDPLSCNDEDYFLDERPINEILPITAPFSEISAVMIVIDDDGLVKKEEIKAGVGRSIQPNDVVLVHYEMYFEGNDTPFDSSIRRKKPVRFRVGCGALIEGLDLALLSMRMQEVSRFFIGWQCAYGEIGCPPRILPKADVLVQIELLKILDIVVSDVAGELPDGDTGFSTTLEQCEKLLQQGKEQYVARNFAESVHKMNDGLKLLDHLPVKSEEEQEKMEKLKVRINVNLAAVHNYCNRPELACNHCNEAMRLDPNHRLALFNFGRAQIRLNNFQKADEVLKKGRSLYPTERKFVDEIKRSEEKKRDLEVRMGSLKVTDESSEKNQLKKN